MKAWISSLRGRASTTFAQTALSAYSRFLGASIHFSQMVHFTRASVRCLFTTLVCFIHALTVASFPKFERGESVANTKKTPAKKTRATRKTATRPKSAAAAKKPSKRAARSAKPASEVKVDRRASKDRRAASDRREKSQPVKVERRKIERREKVSRRRQIDPTTCERDYSIEEIEFMSALEEYKRSSGRMFPTCSEILEVIQNLGYRKLPAGPPADPPAAPPDPPTATGAETGAMVQVPVTSLVHDSLIY